MFRSFLFIRIWQQVDKPQTKILRDLYSTDIKWKYPTNRRVFEPPCLFYMLRNHCLHSESLVSFTSTGFCWQAPPDPGLAQHHLLAVLLQQNRNALYFVLARLLGLSRRRGEKANCIPNKDYTAFNRKSDLSPKYLNWNRTRLTTPSQALVWIPECLTWFTDVKTLHLLKVQGFVCLFVFMYESLC